MSDNKVDVDANEPHLVIDGLGGNQHVIPVSYFDDIRLGKRSLKDLDVFEAVVPTIINEWLSGKSISGLSDE